MTESKLNIKELVRLGFENKYQDDEDNEIWVCNGFEITKNLFENEFWLDREYETPYRIKTVSELNEWMKK